MNKAPVLGGFYFYAKRVIAIYTLTCDGYPLLDLRDERLILANPKVKLEVNTVGEGSFTIHKSHPYFDKLQKLKSVFEIADEYGVIFRGRMTTDSRSFDNGLYADMEGAMAFFNDSMIRPFAFPDDFAENESYIAAAESGNVVEFFLKWLIEQHNAQVQPFQQFKLGTVTVSDPNNYITRSDSHYNSTWNALKSKLFESALGGYLCIRYESDGNYIDYLSRFTQGNTQSIEFGVNLIDLKTTSDAAETYSAIIPIGKDALTIDSLPDGNITDDIVKKGDTLYSVSAVEKFGWIYAPIADTTWEDVTLAANLQSNGVSYLSGTATAFVESVELVAADLHFSDSDIRSFRIYSHILAKSTPHDLQAASYGLMKLEIELLNPQSTKIQVGKSKRTLTESSRRLQSEAIERIQTAEKDIEVNRAAVTEVSDQILTESTEIINTCTEIIMNALESYVETSNYEEFRQTVESQFTVMADEISLQFSSTIERIEAVNSDLQYTIETQQKYFDFTLEDGLIIKAGENQMQIQLDNDMVRFKKSGEQFGWWDGVDFHTGNIVIDVNERAQFGNFAFVPRSDGSLSFMKVGG